MLSPEPAVPDPDRPLAAGEPGDPGEPGEPEVGGLEELVDAALADEPGDEAGDRRYPSTVGGAFYLVVLATALASIVVVVTYEWRLGVRLLAAALGAAGLLRMLLPQRDAGMLAVRHRLIDVVFLVGVGLTLWWLAGSIPDQPGAP